jgi:hypothetical protein
MDLKQLSFLIQRGHILYLEIILHLDYAMRLIVSRRDYK